MNNIFTRHLEKGTSTTIRIYDNWGNHYPLSDKGELFKTIEQARQWLKENFESYILNYWKESAKDFKRKVSYPDYYIIKKETIVKEIINLKSHEF